MYAGDDGAGNGLSAAAGGGEAPVLEHPEAGGGVEVCVAAAGDDIYLPGEALGIQRDA